MKVRLKCRPEVRDKLLLELQKLNIDVTDDAEYTLVESSTINNFLVGRYNGKMEIIKEKDIIYFESLNDNSYCITSKGTYEIKEKLYQIEEKYVHRNFFRVSKSYIVNIQKIKEIIPWVGAKFVLLMENNKEIDVNRTYYYDFKSYLGL